MYYQLPLRHVLDLNFTCLLATFKISGIVTAICNKRHHCNWQLLTVALHWVHVSNHQERCQQSVESPKSEQSARHLGGISSTPATPPLVLGGISTGTTCYHCNQSTLPLLTTLTLPNSVPTQNCHSIKSCRTLGTVWIEEPRRLQAILTSAPLPIPIPSEQLLPFCRSILSTVPRSNWQLW